MSITAVTITESATVKISISNNINELRTALAHTRTHTRDARTISQ